MDSNHTKGSGSSKFRVHSPNPWHWIVDEPVLTAPEKLVALTLLRHHNGERRCWLAMETISNKSRLGRDSTRRALHSLRDRGILEIQERIGRCSVYSLTQKQALLPLRSGKHTPTRLSTPTKPDRGDLYCASKGTPTDTATPPLLNLPAISPVREAGGGTPKKKGAASEGSAPAWDYAKAKFVERYKQEPDWSAQKHWLGITRFMKKHSLEEFKNRWDRFICTTDPYDSKQGGSLAWFCANADKFIEDGRVPVHAGKRNSHGHADPRLARFRGVGRTAKEFAQHAH